MPVILAAYWAAFIGTAFPGKPNLHTAASGAFYRRHKASMTDKLIFNMDCVGDGNHFMFVIPRPARERWEARLTAAFPGDARRRTVFEDAKKAAIPPAKNISP